MKHKNRFSNLYNKGYNLKQIAKKMTITQEHALKLFWEARK